MILTVFARSYILSILQAFIVAFRSAKVASPRTFAERKATLVFRTILSNLLLASLKGQILNKLSPQKISKILR